MIAEPWNDQGGTGDLLAGIISGLISKGMERLRACSAGTFINKKGKGCNGMRNANAVQKTEIRIRP